MVRFQQSVLGNVIGHEDITVTHAEQEPPEGLLQGGDFGYELLSGSASGIASPALVRYAFT